MSCCGTDRAVPAASTSNEASVGREMLRESIRAKYGEAARRATNGERAGCGGMASGCGGTDAGSAAPDPMTGDLYEAGEVADLPSAALQASLGCGNPTALAELHEGETVLDLGSGGGIDVLLSARRVGPAGFAYGLDMTDEMLSLAQENARAAGAANVAFLRGEIENIPLPDGSVDVIISNCVINLSGDKPRVLSEAFRVLRPGGRFAVSDVVARASVPERLRRDLELWAGCVSGALEEGEYRSLLEEAGFEEVDLEPTREYRLDDLLPFFGETPAALAAAAAGAEGTFFSAFVRARKPAA